MCAIYDDFTRYIICSDYVCMSLSPPIDSVRAMIIWRPEGKIIGTALCTDLFFLYSTVVIVWLSAEKSVAESK